MIKLVLPGWDMSESPVGLLAGLVVWATLTWMASRVVASRGGDVERAGGPRALMVWFWLGVAVKASIIVLWYLTVGGHEITPSIGDSASYDASGWQLAKGLREGKHFFSKAPFLEGSYPGFYYWIGAIYGLFGHHPLLVSLFDVLLSVWIAVMLHQIALVLFDGRVAGYTLVAALFYPQWISASYFLLKDVATTFAVTLAIWAVYVPRSLEMRGVVFVGALGLVAMLRAPLAVMVGVLGIAQFALAKTGSGRPRRVLIAALLGIAFVILGASSGSSGKPIFDTGMTTGAGIADDKGFLTGTRLTFDSDGLEAIKNVVIGRPVAFVRYGLDTAIRFFYGPFFLYARGGPSFYPYGPLLSPFRAVLECLSGVFTGLLMPLILVGLYECFRVRRRGTVLLIGWLGVGILSLMLAGALVRWRLPFIVGAFVLVGVGTTRIREMRDIYAAYIVLYVLFMGVNATLYEDMILGKIMVFALIVALAVRFLARRREQLVRAVPWLPAR